MGNVYPLSHDIQPMGYHGYSGYPMRAPLPIWEVEDVNKDTKKVVHLDILVMVVLM